MEYHINEHVLGVIQSRGPLRYAILGGMAGRDSRVHNYRRAMHLLLAVWDMCSSAIVIVDFAIADHPIRIIPIVHFGATGDRPIRIDPNDPYSPFYRRPQVFESIKPPATAQGGDAAGRDCCGHRRFVWRVAWLRTEQVLAETPQIGVVRKIKPDLGVSRDDARLDVPEWSQAIKDLLPATEKPNAIVVMLGISDRLPLRDRVTVTKGTTTPSDNDHPAPAAAATQHQPPGANYEFHTDKWAELYSKRIDDMIAALKTKGAPIIWVGLPAIRGAKSISDMSYLNELYRARRESWHRLCGCLGRLRRRSAALRAGWAGFPRADTAAAHFTMASISPSTVPKS